MLWPGVFEDVPPFDRCTLTLPHRREASGLAPNVSSRGRGVAPQSHSIVTVNREWKGTIVATRNRGDARTAGELESRLEFSAASCRTSTTNGRTGVSVTRSE